MRAMRRAYAQAGFSRRRVGLFEAHGTGTVAGDRAELETHDRVLGGNGAAPASRRHRLGQDDDRPHQVDRRRRRADQGRAGAAPPRAAAAPRRQRAEPGAEGGRQPALSRPVPLPWIRSPMHPRRAAVSAFGFGGTNFHVVLEEYGGEFRAWATPAVERWLARRALLWSAADKPSLIDELTAFADTLDGEAPPLSAVSKACWRACRARRRLALVARRIGDLREKIRGALRHLTATNGGNPLPAETVFTAAPLAGTASSPCCSRAGVAVPRHAARAGGYLPLGRRDDRGSRSRARETPTIRYRAATGSAG